MKLITKILPVGLILLPFVAGAGSLNADGTTSADGTAGAGTTVEATASGSTSANGEAQGDTKTTDTSSTGTVNANIGSSGNDGVSVDVAGTGVVKTSNIGSSGNDDVSVDAAGTGVVKANIGSSGNDGVSVEMSIGDPDFDLFAKTITTENPSVSAVDLDADGSVDVAYKHQGWLFGFIPITVTSHTTVAAGSDGSATAHVRLPWWSFLVSGVSKVRADAEAALNADADVKAHAATQTSLASRVKLVEVMVSSLIVADEVMKATYDLKAAKK